MFDTRLSLQDRAIIARYYNRRGGLFPVEYASWTAMLSRCNHLSNAGYGRYGGRGINVCDRWEESFWNFLDDMGLCPSPAHSLHRIDHDDDYKPGNCKWAVEPGVRTSRM